MVEVKVLKIVCWQAGTHMNPLPSWQGLSALLTLLSGHHICDVEGCQML